MVGTRHAEPSAATAERAVTPETTGYKSTGVWPQVIVGIVVALAGVIFIAQNTHAIHMQFLWLHFRTSPAVLALATALLTVAASVAIGAAWRRRRRRLLTEREELEQLRRVAPSPAVNEAPPPLPASAPPAAAPADAPADAVDLRRDEPPVMPS